MRKQKHRGAFFLLALVVAAGSALLFAQQPSGPIEPKKQKEEEAPYALRVDVPVVSVDVAVTDRDGNFISSLRREHFHIYEDGVEQQITSFAPGTAPLTTVLVVETNRQLRYLLYKNLEAAYYLLNQLTKEDWVALVGVSLAGAR